MVMLCALLASGCQLMSVAEVELPENPLAAGPTDLERLLAAGHWEADPQWSLWDALTQSEGENGSREPWRWKFVFPDPSAKPQDAANQSPDLPENLAELRIKYAWLFEDKPDINPEQWGAMLEELEKACRAPGSVGMTAATLLARCSPYNPHKWDALFDHLPSNSKAEAKISAETYAAAAETLCRVSARPVGDPEVNFAPAGEWLEMSPLPESVRCELFRGIARRIPPRQIPGLNEVMVKNESARLATPVYRAAVEACVIHAWSRRNSDNKQKFDETCWPDGLWRCRHTEDIALRKIFGRWVVLARHPDALAVLKSQRLDPDLGVREEAVASLGLLDRSVAHDELLAVMAKGTDSERQAAITCLAKSGSEEIQPFARDESQRVRASVAKEMGRFPTRDVAITLSDLLRDRSTEVQLAVLEACDRPDWKEHGRVSLLLQALRFGSLRTRMAALTQLRTEWGREPIFPLDGTYEERDAAVRQLAREHNVSTEVFAAFAQTGETDRTPATSLVRQDDARRLIREFLHAAAKSGETISADDLKTLDLAAVVVIEQELERAAGPRAEILYREVLPKLHPGYAALISLESTDPLLRRLAAKELRSLAETASLSTCLLRRLLKRMTIEQDRQVWQDISAAIVPDALPDAAQIALVALNSPWPDIRQFGCDYFERHPQPEYTAWLLPRLQDPDRQIRVRTIRLLARCGHPAALDGVTGDAEAFGLRKLLTDSDQQLRWEAVVAMSTLGDAQAAQELIRQSYDSLPRLREQAVLAMGQTGQTRFVEHLVRRCWTETDRAVQLAMLKSLNQLAPMDDRPGLAPESSISDKINQWARWWESRQKIATPTTAAGEGTGRPLR